MNYCKYFSGIHLCYKCLKANWNGTFYGEDEGEGARVDGIMNSLIVANDMITECNSFEHTMSTLQKLY